MDTTQVIENINADIFNHIYDIYRRKKEDNKIHTKSILLTTTMNTISFLIFKLKRDYTLTPQLIENLTTHLGLFEYKYINQPIEALETVLNIYVGLYVRKNICQIIKQIDELENSQIVLK